MKDFLDFFAEEVASYLLSYNKNNFFNQTTIQNMSEQILKKISFRFNLQIFGWNGTWF